MAEVKNKVKLNSYKTYLETLTKEDIISLLDTFKIKYKKSNKKDSLISLVTSNIKQIVTVMLDYFQIDEYLNILYVIKKGGIVKIKVNYQLLTFLENLNRNHLAIKVSDKEFMLPLELYNALKKKLDDKSYEEAAKQNTEEYSLIMGLCFTYGAYNISDFYKIYKEVYSISEKNFEKRLEDLKDFYKEFNIFKEGKSKVSYITSKEVTNLKTCKSLVKKSGNYKEFSAIELMNIYSFDYMNKFKSYKKLSKFISRNYYVGKGNFKIINKYILAPYLECYQLDKSKAKILIKSLLDKYFEYNSEKHNNHFISLIEDVAKDFPSWKLLGYSEKEKES